MRIRSLAEKSGKSQARPEKAHKLFACRIYLFLSIAHEKALHLNKLVPEGIIFQINLTATCCLFRVFLLLLFMHCTYIVKFSFYTVKAARQNLKWVKYTC